MRLTLSSIPKVVRAAVVMLAVCGTLAFAQGQGERVVTPEGVVVATVDANSPAMRAGIVPGDVVLSIDHHPVWTYNDIQTAIQFRRPGRTIEVSVRHGDSVNLREVRVGALAPDAQNPQDHVVPYFGVNEPVDPDATGL